MSERGRTSANGAPAGDGRSRLVRLAKSLARTQTEVEVEEIREESDLPGVTPIVELEDRQPACVCGVVRTVTLRPRTTVPALAVELYDGTRTLSLVWLGRRRIRGIDPGVFLTARGRMTYAHGVPTIYNPSYELKPARGH